MKTPICSSCASSRNLCPTCQEKLASGALSRLELDLAFTLCELRRYHNLQEAEFHAAFDVGPVVVILTTGSVGLLVGKRGRVVSELSKMLGKKVRIVKTTGDARQSISDLIAPSRLVSINTVFSSGKKFMHVKVSRVGSKLPMPTSALALAITKIMNSPATVSLE